MKNTFAVTVGMALMLSGGRLFAHHAFTAEFDSNKQVKLEGTVIKMEWVNPHSWINLEVKNADGTVTTWMVEGGSPNVLLRKGFTKSALLPGSVILVEGWASKDGSNRANGKSVTFPDGKKLFLGSSGGTNDSEGK